MKAEKPVVVQALDLPMDEDEGRLALHEEEVNVPVDRVDVDRVDRVDVDQEICKLVSIFLALTFKCKM